MKINPADFRVKEGDEFGLSALPTMIDPFYKSNKDYRKHLELDVEELSDMQRKLYADNHWALLLIFQGMDTSGKDGAISHVLSGINPMGFQVFSFRQPSAEELDHDFLWRTTIRLPERGRIGVFNRSYYEEVLVVRVHPEFLTGQNLPKPYFDKKQIWQQRYKSIVEHEAHLVRSGTRVLKFFLNISKQEQARRLIGRIEDKSKNWKFNAGDLVERKLWGQYMRAYEECIAKTSTRLAPWYVVPADDKENARLIVAKIVKEELKDMNLKYPKLGGKEHRDLKTMAERLKSEK